MRAQTSLLTTRLAQWGPSAVLIVVALALSAPEASAMPMFARKYKTGCSTCHYSFPALNAVGEVFRNNGYRFPKADDAALRQDEPLSLGNEEQKRVWPDAIWPSDIPGTIPVAFQGIGRYNYSRSAAIKWTFEFPHELEVFVAGTLGEQFSFFAELEVENAGNEIEVAIPMWLQYSLGPGFHVRMGAVDPEPTKTALRQTRNHYNTNNFRSRNGWRYRDEVFGVEVVGATDGFGGSGGLTYRAGVVNGQGPFSDLNPTKDVYGKVAFKFGGLGEAGGTRAASDTSKFYIDNSVTIGAFTYEGKVRASTGTVDEDLSIYGVNAEAWIDRLRLESVFMVMDSEIVSRADRTSRIGYLESSVVAFPWLIPLARFEWEDADVDVDTVEPVKSLIAGVATMPAANIKFVSEYKKALDTLNKDRKNDTFTLQVSFSF